MSKERIDRLVANLRLAKVPAAAILPSPALYYLTGMSFGLSERPLVVVVRDDAAILVVCPEFEAERVRRAAPFAELCTYGDAEGAGAGFVRLSAQVGELKTVAMEYQAARLLEFMLLKKHCGLEEAVDLRPLLAKQRAKKEPPEINNLQVAASYADELMGFVADNLRTGQSELELVALAEHFAKERGREVAFLSIIGGERTALPHASPSTREFLHGDVVVVDLGCVVQGYYSDITRTFLLGENNEQILEIGKVVQEAQRLAREAVLPGVTAGHIDQVAREHIAGAGYGAYFTHRTGHGIGLEIHEEPYIVLGNEEIIERGHVFTIEPGIYLPGVGGVRIEDDICVTATGAVSLTTYPRAVKVLCNAVNQATRDGVQCRS